MKKQEEKTAKKKKKGAKLGFVAFLVVAFILCIVINVTMSSGKRLETMIVRTGSEEALIDAEGFVFRKQTIVTAPVGGYIYCEVGDEQRVKSGESIASVYKNEINVQANAELKEIDSEINRLSKSTAKENAYGQDPAKVEQSIAHLLRNVPGAGIKGDVPTVRKIKTDVNSLIEERRVISGEIQPQDRTDELAVLKARKIEIEKQYNIERTAVYAPVSGAFISRIDGFEEVLDPQYLADIDGAYLKNLKGKKVSEQVSGRIETGAPIGKIVDNFSWSVAAVVSSKLIDDISVGDSLGVRFVENGTASVEGKVSRIKNEENGKSVIVISCDDYIHSVYSTSIAKVQLIKSRYEGFRVPAASVRMSEGKTGVYIIRNNQARFVPVDILYNNKQWVIVSERENIGEKTLKLYDELIVKGNDIYNGKVVR